MLVGDRVEMDNVDDVNQTGRIVQVCERDNYLTRPKVANVTRALVVYSAKSPDLDFQQLDRYLTQVLIAGIDPMICISKADLVEDDTVLSQAKALYEILGVPVFTASAPQKTGVAAIRAAIAGEVVILAGPSGVGKSSLINAIRPDLNLAVQEVSERAQRGQHTTRQVSLIELDESTLIADSPGFSYLKFDTVLPQEIEAVFVEFAPYRQDCRFDNCLHLDEADCAVKANLEYIAASRYESYMVFQEEAKSYVEVVQTTSQKQEYGFKSLKKGKEKELYILKLPERQRAASRRTLKQQIPDWSAEEDDTLEE